MIKHVIAGYQVVLAIWLSQGLSKAVLRLKRYEIIGKLMGKDFLKTLTLKKF